MMFKGSRLVLQEYDIDPESEIVRSVIQTEMYENVIVLGICKIKHFY